MINLVACVLNYKNKLAIGADSDLLFALHRDLQFFKSITTGTTVVMGRKTWESIGKPLANRINIVLTNDSRLHKKSGYSCWKKYVLGSVYFFTLGQFKRWHARCAAVRDVFVIGGSEIYKIFLDLDPTHSLAPSKLYITHVTGTPKVTPNVFMPHFDSSFVLSKYSGRIYEDNASYRFLEYTRIPGYTTQEFQYLEFMNNIVNLGVTKSDRTGTGTRSLFGNTLRFDISDTIPLMTTKRVPYKTIIEELLWFCRGDTDAKILQAKGISIWDGNSSREFLDARGLKYPEGVIGPQYGFLWRHFGAGYIPLYADTSKVNRKLIGGFDQLRYIENLLDTDPDSRRIMMSAWAPHQLSMQALPSCHTHVQFYTRVQDDQRYLSCAFYMRSNDTFLAMVYNIVSYSILVHILALRHGMKPDSIVYMCGDSHIYLDHITAFKEQCENSCRPFPKLSIDPSIANKDWSEMSVEDFDVIGYFPHAPIRAKMAI